MRRCSRLFWPLAAILVFALAPEAQVRDSLWQQDMEAIGVTPTSGAAVPASGGASIRRIVLSDPASGPSSVAEIARRVPSAHVQTNSRGETLVYLRGSGERQLVVTLDGAPLTIPWDRRADLGLVPTGALDGLIVVTGTPSVAWGPNALGGAIDLVSRRASGDGTFGDLGVSGGLPGAGRGTATGLWREGAWSATVSAEADAREGDRVARGADLPFSQNADALRTNTDRRRASGLVRLAWAPEANRSLALTVLHARAARGVAPEGHVDPAEESVRFWRTPQWRHSLIALNARSEARLLRLRATAWGSTSGQTIAQYENATYTTIATEQVERDASGGLRLLAEAPRAWGVVRATAYGQIAEHRERETGAPEETFRHATTSVGLEAETAGRVRFTAGAALDAMAPLATGLRPNAGPFRDVALGLGGVWDVSPAVRLRAGGGRKTRFPSMRELFGGALGRFALNPDLRPESGWLAEAGVELDRGPLAGTLVAFSRDVTGTIDQVVLDDGRRQRRNLAGSTAYGVEATGDWDVSGSIRLEGALTLLRQRSDDGDRLTERPGAMGRLGVRLARGPWRMRAWADGIGSVLSPTPDGRVELPGAVLGSGELVRQWSARGALVELSARIDNALDTLYTPQAGLPAPGRSASFGARILF